MLHNRTHDVSRHPCSVLSLRHVHEVQQVELFATCRGDKISPKLVLHNYKSISLHEGTCRCNISLGHVPATFPCVCKCCDFVPATCPRYGSLLRVASVCTKQVFVAACRCDMSLQHDPPCLPTLTLSIYNEKSLQCISASFLYEKWPLAHFEA